MRSPLDYTLGETLTMIRADTHGVNRPDMLASIKNCVRFVEWVQAFEQHYKVQATAQLVRERKQEDPPRVTHRDVNSVPCELVESAQETV